MRQPTSDSKVHPSSGAAIRLDSRRLFDGASVVEIDHNGQRYQLRITRENKLILTK